MVPLWCHCGAVIFRWRQCGGTVLILWCTVVTVRLYHGSTMAVLCSKCCVMLVYILLSLFGATVVPLWWICGHRATGRSTMVIVAMVVRWWRSGDTEVHFNGTVVMLGTVVALW